MNGDYLSALALLKVSYDEHGSTFVDYVLPFVGDTIRASGTTNVTVTKLKTDLHDRYGLDIPEAVLNTLTRRLGRSGYGERSHGSFLPDKAALERDFNFEDRRRETQAQISSLANLFVDFLQSELNRVLTETEAIAALTAYTERNGLPILQRALREDQLITSLSLDDLEYLASRFVIHVFEARLPARETLIVLAKGSKLASVLYLPNPSEVGRKFDELLALLDTPTLLSALGYQGETAETAAREVLDLAYENGIRLGVLEDTVREIESILDAVGQKVGRRGYARTQLRGVEAHFLKVGLNASDIKLLAAQLVGDLESLRVRVVPKPRMSVDLSIDEASLEECLQSKVRYPRREPLLHDLDALTATFRLRKGARPNDFESCRAIFVSTNVPLVRAGREFFRREYGEHWPLGITEDDFATLLWLKRPLAAPDLPAHRLLADAYNALEPGLVDWGQYLEEIDKLKERGELAEEQYFFLRYSSEAKQALMEEKLAKPSGITADSVNEIVNRVREDLIRPGEEEAERLKAIHEATLRAELEAQENIRSERDAALESQASALKDAAQARSQAERMITGQRNAARRRAERIARRVRIGALVGATLVVGIGVWFSAPAEWGLPPQDPSPIVAWIARISVGAILLLGGGSLIFGWQISNWVRRLEVALARRIEYRRLVELGLEGVDELSDVPEVIAS